MKSDIIILTGEKNSGKTSFLKKWITTRHDVRGILSPVESDRRYFFDISTKEEFRMMADEHEEAYSVGRYRFSITAFEKANQILLHPNANTRYLVIDEIGPLEILSKKGFFPALMYLLQNPGAYILVLVCRAGLALDLKDLCVQLGRTSAIQTTAINSLPETI